MRFLIVFLLTLIIFPMQEAFAADRVKDWGLTTEVAPMKEWTITFKSEIDSSALEHINILDEQSNVKPMKKSMNAAKNAVILTPITPYEEDEIYTLKIDKQLKSADGERLVEGGEKRFYVPSQQKSELVLKSAVQQTSDFKLQSSQKIGDETTYQFIYNGTNTYAVNDLIIVNNLRNFEGGFAGKVTAIVQQNGQYVISMVQAPLEDIVESLVINDEMFLTAQHLRSVVVAGYDVQAYNVKDTALDIVKGELRLTPKFNTSVNGKDAQIEFVYILKDLKLNFDVDVSKMGKLKKVRVSISGTQSVEKIAKFGRIGSDSATILDRPSLKGKEGLKDFEYKLARVPITISIPGVTGYVESGFIFEVGIAGGAQFSTEEETKFEFGTLYKNDKFHEIIESDSDTRTSTVMGFGELDAKFGIYNAVGIQLFSKPLVEATVKGGAYSTFGVYAGFTAGSKACFAVESGAFTSIGIALLPDSRSRLGAELEKKLPFAKPLDCEEVQSIQPTSSEITLINGQTKKIKVEKTTVNLKNGKTDTSNIKAKKLKYTYDENAVSLDEKTGEVSFKNSNTNETTVNISYNEDGKTFKTSVQLIKVQDEKVIQKAIDEKTAQLQAQGFNVFESKMLDTGRQLLTAKLSTTWSSDANTMIAVHNYDETNGKWSKVYEKNFVTTYGSKKKPITMNNDSLEQHVFFSELGSWRGEWPQFMLIGSKDGKTIETLYLEDDYDGYGTVEMTSNSFLICDYGEGKQFKWNGSKFVTNSTSCDSPSDNTDFNLYDSNLKNDVLYMQPTVQNDLTS